MADLCKVIHVTVPNAVGKLAEVTGRLKDAGVNLMAICAWTEGDTAHLKACTADPEAACSALGGEGGTCDFQDVVCVRMGNQPGTLNAVAAKLAEAGIDILCVFSTMCDAADGCVVFCTSDNAKAVEVL